MASGDRRAAGVVLAAGSSTRMGRNKLLLELDGEPLVRRAVRAAVEAGLGEVVVVLGHEEERVRAALAGLPCTLVSNPEHERGPGTSLRAGVRHVRDTVGAVVIVLADMPRVPAEMSATVARRYRETGAPLVVSRYGDVQAPPTLYDRSLFGEVLAIPDDRGAKQVARDHAGAAVVVTWPEDASRDVDAPSDYESLL